ncbi:imm11 family protein [Archangium lansingense]|uniref:imm11 family protein n=1 Tax=Archangium lansingense TaxID=2995310 RepID=UPI003B79719F
MAYFQVDTLGDDVDEELACVLEEPGGLEGMGFKLAQGEPIGDAYPQDARVYLDPYSTGVKLCPLLGNTVGYLIVNGAIKAVLERHDVHPVELHPVSVYNQRKRLHGRGYWIVNPLRFVDCVDRRASQIQYSTSAPSQIVAIEELVFRRDALKDAGDLFRIREQPMSYFISERVAADLQRGGFTNVFLNEVREEG